MIKNKTVVSASDITIDEIKNLVKRIERRKMT